LAGLQDVPVRVTLEWGRSQLTVEEAAALGDGSLVRLAQQRGDLVDVLVNDRLYGRGRLVMVEETYGVQLVELVGER